VLEFHRGFDMGRVNRVRDALIDETLHTIPATEREYAAQYEIAQACALEQRRIIGAEFHRAMAGRLRGGA